MPANSSPILQDIHNLVNINLEYRMTQDEELWKLKEIQY